MLSVKSCNGRQAGIQCECEITLIILLSVFFYFFSVFSLSSLFHLSLSLLLCVDSHSSGLSVSMFGFTDNIFYSCLFVRNSTLATNTKKIHNEMNERKRMELSCQFCIYNTNKIITINSE